MWLKLTTVSFHGAGKKQTSMVRELRINMDTIECYFEAPDEAKNNVSEQARCNTILMVVGDKDKAYHAKETVEEIDKMINCGWANTQSDLSFKVSEDKIEVKSVSDGWSDWK